MKLPTHIIPTSPVYDLTAHLAHVRKLYQSYPYNAYDKNVAALPGIMTDICDRFPYQIADELGEAVRALLRNNNVFFHGEPDELDRDYLARLSYVLGTPSWPKAAIEATVDLFRLVVSRLPEPVYEEHGSTLKVPLHALLDVPDLIMRIMHMATKTHGDVHIFESLRKVLFWNTIQASGYDLDSYDNNPLTFPHESTLETDELVEAYLHDTPFFNLLNLRVPFSIPDSVRNEHILMVARTGSGKTQFIQHDILNNLVRPDGPGMVVIDSQNQMIPKLEMLQAARDRIVIVDPFDASPPALNMFLSPRPPFADPNLREAFEANTLQQFAWIFSALDQELTGRQNTLFTFTTRILLAMKANMQTMLEFLRIQKPSELKSSEFWHFIESSDEQTRYFFENRFCTTDYNKTKDGVADRLLGVLRVPSFNRMFMAPANNLDLHSLLAQRKLVVFNTRKSHLGNDASAILGRYAIALYIRAAFERELDRDPHPAFLYVDEASEYFGKKDSTDVLFTQLRKHNCGTFVAFQELSQLGDQQYTLISQTTTKLTGALSVADAGKLARDMRTAEHELLRTAKRDNRFEMHCYIGNVTPRAVKLSFEYGAVENAAKLGASEHAAMRERNRRLLSVQPAPPPAHTHAVVSPAIEQTPAAQPAPHDDRQGPAQPQSSEVKPGKIW